MGDMNVKNNGIGNISSNVGQRPAFDPIASQTGSSVKNIAASESSSVSLSSFLNSNGTVSAGVIKPYTVSSTSGSDKSSAFITTNPVRSNSLLR